MSVYEIARHGTSNSQPQFLESGSQSRQTECQRAPSSDEDGRLVPSSSSAHHVAHDSILALGYDWSHVSDPGIAPKYPAKVYLPRSTDDIIRAVRETRQLGQKLTIRGSGHSSNDLVLAEGGAILWTTLFNNIVAINEDELTVVVQSGAMLAGVDEHLATMGLGLPVIGDHTHLTAGGFASVGGVSPASHRLGMFVDNVLAIEIVDWNGWRHVYTKEHHPRDLNRILGGTGRHGIIATLTLRIERIEKHTTVVENDRFITRDMDAFIARSRANIENDDVLYQRSIWDERPVLGQTLIFGQCTAYGATRPSWWKTLRERIAFGTLHSLRNLAGKLPPVLGRAINMLGGLGFIFTPRFSTIKNIESFTEKVVDHTVGDPIRFLAVLAPMSAYDELFRKLHALAAQYRDVHGCLTSVSLYSVGLKSVWLAGGTGERYCDLLLYLGLTPKGMSSPLLDELVAEVDKACVAHKAFRYMHSRTSTDDAIRGRIDPNERHATAIDDVPEAA